MKISKNLNKYQLLKRAARDEEVLAKMDLEDEVDNLIEKHIRENQLLKESLEEKDKVLETLKKEKIAAVKSLIINTDLTDEQISSRVFKKVCQKKKY